VFDVVGVLGDGAGAGATGSGAGLRLGGALTWVAIDGWQCTATGLGGFIVDTREPIGTTDELCEDWKWKKGGEQESRQFHWRGICLG
jgi:hypothetical protein